MRRALLTRLRSLRSSSRTTSDKQLVLQSLPVAKQNRALPRIRSLAEVEFGAFSQWGEDGIIDWLIDKMAGISSTFVEFGVGNYREANTRLLLYLRNWRGLVLDGSREHIADIIAQDIYWRFDLVAQSAFIDRDNINSLFTSNGFDGDVGLLSIDLDGNDYWVWEAIDVINPWIVVCEYNAVFGDLHELVIPYQAGFQRSRAHPSNLYFGASLPALVRLGSQKGYTFIGTNSNGCNAFFLRSDCAERVITAIDEIRAFGSRFRESRDRTGQLTFKRDSERIVEIRHLPVIDLETNTIRSLGDLGELCSERWRAAS